MSLSLSEQVSKLVRMSGNQQAAVNIIKNETGYEIQQSTISRLCRGEGKPAMFYFVIYILENGLSIPKGSTKESI